MFIHVNVYCWYTDPGMFLSLSLRVMPSLSRLWHASLSDHHKSARLQTIVGNLASPKVIKREMDLICNSFKSSDGRNNFQGDDDDGSNAGEFQVRKVDDRGEIYAKYVFQEAVLELSIKMPAAYPLQAAQVMSPPCASI